MAKIGSVAAYPNLQLGLVASLDGARCRRSVVRRRHESKLVGFSTISIDVLSSYYMRSKTRSRVRCAFDSLNMLTNLSSSVPYSNAKACPFGEGLS